MTDVCLCTKYELKLQGEPKSVNDATVHDHVKLRGTTPGPVAPGALSSSYEIEASNKRGRSKGTRLTYPPFTAATTAP